MGFGSALWRAFLFATIKSSGDEMIAELKDRFRKLQTNTKVALVVLFWWVGLIAVVIWLLHKIISTRFFRQHKKVIIPILLLLVITPFAIHSIRMHIEEGRDYYIKTADYVTFDCNPTYNSQTQQMACQERTLKGQFSNYDSVDIEYGSTSGNEFSKPIQGYVFYTLQDLDTNSFEKGVDTDESVILRNNVLKKNVVETNIKVHYKLTVKDIAQIKQIYSDWKVAEEKRVTQERADKLAQEEAKKKSDEENKAADNVEQNKQENTPKIPSTNPNEDALFEADITCQEYAESYFGVKDVNVHYDQSSIRRKNADGTLLIKANIADSQGAFKPEKPLGTMECTTDSTGMQVINFIAY